MAIKERRTITSLLLEKAREHGDPLELLGKEFDFLNRTEEIRKLVFENVDFKERVSSKNIHYDYFDDISVDEYQSFLNSLNFTSPANVRNWLGLNPENNVPFLRRTSAMQILFALGVEDIARANQFILRSCGNEAYAFYSRDYKDLIYKFCLQNGLSMSCAESLIEEHKYIELGSYRLLKGILSEMSDPDTDLIQLVWENFYTDGYARETVYEKDQNGKEKRKNGKKTPKRDENNKIITVIKTDDSGNPKKIIAGGESFIKIFCKLYSLDADKKKAKKIRDISISKYKSDLKDDTAYITLKSVLKSFNVCDDKQIEAFIEEVLCDDFYKNEVSSGKAVIHRFCVKAGFNHTGEEAAVKKYTDTIDEIKRTSVFDEKSKELKNVDDLKIYLDDNQNQFGMYRRTAYEKFRYYYELVAPKESNFDVEENERIFGEIYNHMMSIDDDVNDCSLFERLPNYTEWNEKIGQNELRNSTLSIVQKIIRDSGAVIDDSKFKDMKNFKEQIQRKYFIWIFMYTWGEMSDYQTPMLSLNEELTACGFPILNSRNPFDFIIINAMYRESIIEQRKSDKSLPENERRKLMSINFSAIDGIKKVVKDFYSIEL